MPNTSDTRDPKFGPLEVDVLSIVEQLAEVQSVEAAIVTLGSAARASLGAEVVEIIGCDRQVGDTSSSRNHGLLPNGLRDVSIAIEELECRTITLPFELASVSSIRFRWLTPPSKEKVSALQALGRAASLSAARLEEHAALVERVAALTLTSEELRHRLKNAYASAAGLAALSLPKDRVGEFRSRIMSLMATYDAIDGGASSAGSSDLGSDITTLLNPYQRCEDTPIRLTGPLVPMSRALRAPLALVINELATNALKHGALAKDCGRIDVNWHVQEGIVHLEWRETSSAFSPRECALNEGSRILKELVQRNLLGDISRVVGPDGIQINLSFAPTT
jgi:two-component sensor histidine kinase